MIPTESDYKSALIRLEELLPLSTDEMNETDPLIQELNHVSNIIEAYETEYYPIGEASFFEVLKFRFLDRIGWYGKASKTP